MNHAPDEAGHVYGRLTVLYRAANDAHGCVRWHCRCVCGAEVDVEATKLRAGTVRSCGCLSRELTVQRNKARTGTKRNGYSHTVEYAALAAAHKRCENPKTPGYAYYGGRGIKVCPQWSLSKAGYEAFLAEVGPRPGDGYSLDRIDVNGDYAPGNVRWATAEQQANNRRSNRTLVFNGMELTVAQWARRLHLTDAAVHARLQAGLPLDQVLRGK